jgi:predicted transglutaminase-like cysteine proteinase
MVASIRVAHSGERSFLAVPPASFSLRSRFADRPRHTALFSAFLFLASIHALGMTPAAADLFLMERLAAARYGTEAAASIRAWRNMIADAGSLSESERIERVNRFINRRTRFEDDEFVWKQQDHWETPLELLARRAGDCEDFAIAKYASLRLLGISTEKLRLIYVRARIGAPGSNITQAHMVLAYYLSPDADPLLLDNLIEEIRPASQRPDLFPVFGFNHERLWAPGDARSSADPTARLSRWRGVLERMQREGLDLS